MSTIHSPDYDLLARFPETDDVPLDTPWHRDQIDLLVELARYYHRDREDCYVGGNMFVYWDSNDPRKSSGPDFMFLKGVERHRERHIWAVWREDGHFPNAIVELMSPRTKNKDRKTNKTKYEQVFQTPDYFYYDPETEEFRGWRLVNERYEALLPNDQGWLWSEEIGLWLGQWYGPVNGGEMGLWLRFFDPDGNLAPRPEEEERQRAEAANERAEAADEQANVARMQAETARKQAEAADQRADRERIRAEAADAEIARLRALLEQSSDDKDSKTTE